MTVTVDGDGRAVAVGGDAEHPITAGFLCGKVSNYLDRVYAPDRILHPLVRDGAKGEGSFRRASWDEALERVATELLRVRDEFHRTDTSLKFLECSRNTSQPIGNQLDIIWL